MKGLKEKLKKANTVQLTKEQIINIIYDNNSNAINSN